MVKQNYIEQILGMADVKLFLIVYAFGLLGVLMSILLHVNGRDKTSPDTPVPFSWKFFIQDNLQRIVTALILLFLGIRFAGEMFGMGITMWTALVVGFCLDKVAQFLKNMSLEARK
jgi:hypothetical protein